MFNENLNNGFSFLLPRCPLQAKLYVSGKDHPEAPVQSLRSHLPPALWLSHAAARGGPPQHVVQTLHLFCSGTKKKKVWHLTHVFILVILCVSNTNREDNLISPFPLSLYRSSTSLTGKSWCHFRSWSKNWQPRIDKQQHNPYFIGLLVFAQIPTPPWLYGCSIYYISIWGNVFNNARKKEGSW